jgi:hypothetical protein
MPTGRLSVEEFACCIEEETGIRFGGPVIEREIENYNNTRAPPYIEEVEAGAYRLRHRDDFSPRTCRRPGNRPNGDSGDEFME